MRAAPWPIEGAARQLCARAPGPPASLGAVPPGHRRCNGSRRVTTRLHIAWIIDTAVAAPAGGVVAARRIVDGLRRRLDVTVVGIGGDQPMPAVHVPFFQKLIDANQFAIARPEGDRLWPVVASSDVVHIQLPFLLGLRALHQAKDLGIPTVAAHHVQAENALANVGIHNRRLADFLNRQQTRLFFNRADHVICPSQFAWEELLRVGLTTPATVVSNGVDPRFAPARRRPHERFTVLAVGRLAAEKRHDLIIDAVARARHGHQVRLVIAGRGPTEERLREQAQRLGVSLELGFVPDDELLRLYQSADLLVHASEVELEGLAVLEAMHCGCPALIADAPSSAAPQFATGPRQLFRAGDADDLARHLDGWFEHPFALEAERARALETSRPFTLEHTLDVLEALYRSLVRGPPRASPPLSARGPSSTAS